MRKDARNFLSRGRIAFRRILPGICLIVGGCALPGLVQRQTVEYNTAAAGMANQLVLLNIARAKEHLPLFYTSISRLSGSAVVTAGGGFNAALKTTSPTITSTPSSAVVTTADGLPTTTATTTLSGLTHAVTSGGDLYTPSVTGQIVSGPSFDINILDTQQFYNGILQEVPMSTVETFVNQHFDNKLLIRLLIDRIELRWMENNEGHRTGQLLDTLYNAPADTKENGGASTLFLAAMACKELKFEPHSKPPRPLAPGARITGDKGDKSVSIRDLALLDGEKFDLAVEKPGSPVAIGPEENVDSSTKNAKGPKKSYDTSEGVLGSSSEANVFVVRVSKDSRLPKLPRRKDCSDDNDMPKKASAGLGVAEQTADRVKAEAMRIADELSSHPPVPPIDSTLPNSIPPSKPIKRDLSPNFLSEQAATGKLHFQFQPWSGQLSTTEPSPRGVGTVTITYDGGTDTVEALIYFRSPEGIIRYLGKYLEATGGKERINAYLLDDTRRVFYVDNEPTKASLVKIEIGKNSYSIPPEAANPDMDVLALLEELIDLQKSGTDRPVTVPVHVLQ